LDYLFSGGWQWIRPFQLATYACPLFPGGPPREKAMPRFGKRMTRVTLESSM
jgi:hypothetical protein